jgi:hypothetical protein
LLFSARCTSVQILGVKRGQSRLHRNMSHWNATSRPLLSARAHCAPYATERSPRRARSHRSVRNACATSFPATCRAPLACRPRIALTAGRCGGCAHAPAEAHHRTRGINAGVGLATNQALPSTPHHSYKRPRSSQRASPSYIQSRHRAAMAAHGELPPPRHRRAVCVHPRHCDAPGFQLTLIVSRHG